jgi:hypothetical protein
MCIVCFSQARVIISTQSGVIRTNCIDCLDRTNLAQQVIGEYILNTQLDALDIIPRSHILTYRYQPTSTLIHTLYQMYNTMGNTLAYQYAGSHLVNTLTSYKKDTPWTSHSRDTIESLKRLYSNSFTDAEKQCAINLFLGVSDESERFREKSGSLYEYVSSVRLPRGLDCKKEFKSYVSLSTLLQETV